MIERLAVGARRRRRDREARARVRPGARGGARGRRGHRRVDRGGRRQRAAHARAPLRRARRAAARACGGAAERARGARPRGPRRARARARERHQRRRGRAGGGPRGHAPAGPARASCASCPCAAPRSTPPAAASRTRRRWSWASSRPRVAGVDEIVVAAPAHPVILAACALCEVDEVYRMGGAQAIAALALGTETIPRVDVIVGPGNLYVQEAKRQVSGRVGIDGFAGPSRSARAGLRGRRPAPRSALDLLAQAEHGTTSLVVAVSDEGAFLDAVGRELQTLFQARPSIAGGPKVLVDAPGLDAALAFAEAFAPEHLELLGDAAEGLAPRVRSAGCLFVGSASATAFGDYVAGSNHILPTDGAARFASGLHVGPLPPPHERGADRRRRGCARAAGRGDRGRGGLRGARGVDVRPDPRESVTDMTARTAQLSRADRRDRRQRRPRPRRRRRSSGSPPASASSTTCWSCSPATARLGLGVTVTGDLETGRAPHGGGHRDRARPGARRGARRPRRHPPLRPRRRADGRGARDVRDRHLRPAVLQRDRAGAAAGRDRRVRARGRGGVLPRRGERRRGSRSTSSCRPARTRTT